MKELNKSYTKLKEMKKMMMGQKIKITTKVVTSSTMINNFISIKDQKMTMVMITRIIIKVMIVKGKKQTEMKVL